MVSGGASPDTQAYKATVRNLYNPHYSNPFGTITFTENERKPKNFIIQKRGSVDARKIQAQDFSMYESSDKKPFDTIQKERQDSNGYKILLPLFEREKQRSYFHSIRKSAADQANPKFRLLEMSQEFNQQKQDDSFSKAEARKIDRYLQDNVDLNLQDLSFKKIRLPLKQVSKAFELKQRGRTIDQSSLQKQGADNSSTLNSVNNTLQSIDTSFSQVKTLPPIAYAESPVVKIKQQRHYRNNSTLYESGMGNSLDLMSKFLKQKGQEQLQRSFALNGAGALENIQLDALPYQSYDRSSGTFALRNLQAQNRDQSNSIERAQVDSFLSPKSSAQKQFGIHNGCEIMIDAHKKYSDMSRFYKNIVDSRVGQNGKLSFMRPNIR